MYKRISIVMIGLLLAFQLQAQSVKKLTLKEAVELGVTNSKQLAVSNAKVKEAQAKVSQASDKVWPEIGISGMYMRINQPNVKMAGESNANNNSGSGDSPLAAFSNLSDIGLAQASASMPLFNGFRIRNNKAMSEYLEEAARYDEQTTKSHVTLNTTKAVYQYYELLETRKTISESLKQEQQRVQEFKNQEAQHLLARNDRLKAELQASNVELALTTADNNVKLAEYNLIVLLGLPDDSAIELDTAGMFKLNVNKLTPWTEYLQIGLTNRQELKASDVQIKASEAGYKVARANRLPTVALTAGYINLYIPNVVTVTNAINGGVSLKYSITGAIHASHAMQEAKAKKDQIEISKKMMEDQVKVDIRGKYLNCQKSLDQLTIAEKSIEQAEENFQISQNKYKNGLLILSDYLDADVALLQARINYATAKAESMIAFYELQESTGTL